MNKGFHFVYILVIIILILALSDAKEQTRAYEKRIESVSESSYGTGYREGYRKGCTDGINAGEKSDHDIKKIKETARLEGFSEAYYLIFEEPGEIYMSGYDRGYEDRRNGKQYNEDAFVMYGLPDVY